jgi:hypothetical protein
MGEWCTKSEVELFVTHEVEVGTTDRKSERIGIYSQRARKGAILIRAV